MSLNFQFTNKEKFDAMSNDEKTFNDAFIWGCLVVDMDRITEHNWQEWIWRYSFAIKLNGAFYWRADKRAFIPTEDEIKLRIGLTTNVSSKTRNQFIKKQIAIFSN